MIIISSVMSLINIITMLSHKEYVQNVPRAGITLCRYINSALFTKGFREASGKLYFLYFFPLLYLLSQDKMDSQCEMISYLEKVLGTAWQVALSAN